MNEIGKIRENYLRLIDLADTDDNLEKLRIEALGKKGEISILMRDLGRMVNEKRRVVGPELNKLKNDIAAAFTLKKDKLFEIKLENRLNQETLDITAQIRPKRYGTIHPVSQVTQEIMEIFSGLGFFVAEGPQIESDWYNFDALNIPPEHPARQEFDTFYISNKNENDVSPNVLRTHTSPVQIRHMEQQGGVPCKIIVPGRVYRSDYDMTHTPMFNQVEGLAIGEDYNMANLKWVLEEFCRTFFEVENVELRFRASHFPFTEPSAEVDLRCSWKEGQLKVGEGDDWMEILGSGMVHPKVLEACKVDPEKYQGFAFGMGIDRLAMLKYGIPDLRSFFDSDLRWLKHFGFRPLNIPSIVSGLSE